jgi:hypothetical protein
MAMPLQRLLEEAHRCFLVALLSNVTFEDLTFVIDSSPQVVRLAINLYEHLIDVPPPVSKSTHPADPLSLDVSCKHRTEPVPPMPNRFMSEVDAAFCKQILYDPQTERKADVHHHNQPDEFR